MRRGAGHLGNRARRRAALLAWPTSVVGASAVLTPHSESRQCVNHCGDLKATWTGPKGFQAPGGKCPSPLRQNLDKPYGWTSDADGIRHPMLEEAALGFNDAGLASGEGKQNTTTP